MHAARIMIGLAALLALAGVAAAQNAPCPECDPDGQANPDNSYHSVDAGLANVTGDGSEVLADTDVAYGHTGDEKGFWTWIQLCLSVFLDKIEDAVGIHTDLDANAEVYASEEGVDLDASARGLQDVCTAIGVQKDCDYNFDESELGELDGKTWETMSTIEAATGMDVSVPSELLPPDTGSSDTDVCIQADIELVACG